MSQPEIIETADTAPYWRALSEGRLDFQHCRSCGHGWLPGRHQCPACLSSDTAWKPASGKGRIVSWVVYHTAYAPHLAERVPYNVAVVELAEGPRLITNIVDQADASGLSLDAPVELAIETDFGRALPRFRLEKTNAPPDWSCATPQIRPGPRNAFRRRQSSQNQWVRKKIIL